MTEIENIEWIRDVLNKNHLTFQEHEDYDEKNEDMRLIIIVGFEIDAKTRERCLISLFPADSRMEIYAAADLEFDAEKALDIMVFASRVNVEMLKYGKIVVDVTGHDVCFSYNIDHEEMDNLPDVILENALCGALFAMETICDFIDLINKGYATGMGAFEMLMKKKCGEDDTNHKLKCQRFIYYNTDFEE